MNHPYLYPDQAPWTEDYQDLMQILHQSRVRDPDDDDDHSDEPHPDTVFHPWL